MLQDPLFWIAAIIAVSIVGIGKGGFVGLGVLGTPILALVMSPVQAAAILLPILCLQDVVTMAAYRGSFDRRILAISLTGAILGTIGGYLLASTVTDAHVRLIVGIVALVFAANWWIGLAQQRASGPKPGPVAGVIWGALAGFTSFVSHAGGPPFQIYVLPQRLEPNVLVGTTAWFFAILNAVKLIPYAALGEFDRVNLTASAALAPVAILSTMAGVWIVRRIETARFYKIVYALLLLVGLKLVYDGLVAIL
jgi:uncharacterized membrane protein YfcA